MRENTEKWMELCTQAANEQDSQEINGADSGDRGAPKSQTRALNCERFASTQSYGNEVNKSSCV